MKRIFAAALAACLMLLAAGAMAQGHGSDWKTITQSYCDSLVDGTLSSGKYCLGEDVACDFDIRKGATVTLCLCGHTISSGAQNAIDNEGSLTLEDCSAAKAGKVYGGTFGVYNKGVFTMNGGTVGSGYSGVENDGQFTMNEGFVTGALGVYMLTAEEDSQSNTFIMNGGVVKGEMYGVVCETREENAYGASSQFTMNAGTVTGGYFGVLDLFSKMDISEGTIGGGMYAVTNEELSMLVEAEAEEKYIVEGSYKESGAFGEKEVVIKKSSADDPEPPVDDPEPPTDDPEPPVDDPEPPVIDPEEPVDDPEPPMVAPELPKTGDSSMLLCWVTLLGAAGAGLKLRRRG